MNLEQAKAKRLSLWRQDGTRNVADSAAGAQMIDEMGLVTLYGASPEFPSLLLAHVGNPDYVSEASWDSPGGFVYGWRWDLGKTKSAFYSTIVAKKPTWVAWSMLPTVLAALMNRTTPETLYRNGQLSNDASKVYKALNDADHPLTTKELRSTAGFPTGKANRAAYLKAVEELETHLFLAKVFSPDMEGDEMSHGLVAKLYPEAHHQAMETDLDAAIKDLVLNHVKHSAYVDAATFAKHLRLPPKEVLPLIEEIGLVRLDETNGPYYTTKENL